MQKFPYISQTCYITDTEGIIDTVFILGYYYEIIIIKRPCYHFIWAKNRKKMIEKQDSIKNQSIDSHATFNKTFINNTSAFMGSIINKLDWEQGHIDGRENYDISNNFSTKDLHLHNYYYYYLRSVHVGVKYEKHFFKGWYFTGVREHNNSRGEHIWIFKEVRFDDT